MEEMKGMKVRQALANRIFELCREREIAINALAYSAGIPPMTVYCLTYQKRQNPGIVTIKMLCDGLGITLGEFFSTPEFDALEQELE